MKEHERFVIVMTKINNKDKKIEYIFTPKMNEFNEWVYQVSSESYIGLFGIGNTPTEAYNRFNLAVDKYEAEKDEKEKLGDVRFIFVRSPLSLYNELKSLSIEKEAKYVVQSKVCVDLIEKGLRLNALMGLLGENSNVVKVINRTVDDML